MHYGDKHKSGKAEKGAHGVVVRKSGKVYEFNKVMAVGHDHMAFLHSHKGDKKADARCNGIFDVMRDGLSYLMLKAKHSEYEEHDSAYEHGRESLLVCISHFSADRICYECRDGKAGALRERQTGL